MQRNSINYEAYIATVCERDATAILSVCPFVTFVYCVETARLIIKLFPTRDSPIILVFLY